MEILQSMWERDGKYAREEGIRRCWRKAGILPIGKNTEIDAELGSTSTSAAKKSLSKEDCDELCSLMKDLSTKTKNLDVV